MSKQPTTAELKPRIAKAKQDADDARAALAQAQELHESSVIAGEKELDVQRLKRGVEDAMGKLAAANDRVRLLERANAQAFEHEQGEERAAKILAGDKLLAERAAEFERLDKLLAGVAKSIVRCTELSTQSLLSLPERPRHTPALFTAPNLARFVGLRLQGLTEGALIPAKSGLNNWEAQQLPTLGARAADERVTVMSEYGVEPTQAAGSAR